MKYVLDSSVALKWVLPEAHSSKACQLHADFRTAIHELISPDIFSVECAHALTRAERRSIIQQGHADLLFFAILLTAPHFHPHQPILGRAIAISSMMRQDVYDCVYVALAEREKCELITADDKLVKNLSPSFPFILPLASFP